MNVKSDIPENVKKFHEKIWSSSDGFWYSLQNGYIDVAMVTSTPLDELTYVDLCRIQGLAEDYGIEF